MPTPTAATVERWGDGYCRAVEQVSTDPDDHLRSLSAGIRDDMVALDAIIRGAMPGRRRVLWEGIFWAGTAQTIVGYGALRQPRPDGKTVDWFVVGLARQKRYISVYVNAVEDNEYLLARYAGRLGEVKTGTASIRMTSIASLDKGSLH